MASNAAKLPVKKEKLQPLRSKFQELILRAVIAKEVKVVEDTIALFKENHSLFSSDDQHAGKPFRPFDFFPLSEAASQRQTQGDPTVNVKVQKEYQSHSPLMIACEDKQKEIISLLIENGASVALKNKYGLTAVHIACRRGDMDILHKLLTAAKLQKFVSSGMPNSRFTSDCEAVLMTRAKKGWYPVMFAVKGGHVELVKECFNRCDLKTITTKKKQTVLHLAAKAAMLPCLKEVMPLATVDIKKATDKKGWNVFHHACASGSVDVMKWLMENMDKDVCSEMICQESKCQHTPLMTACEYKKTKVVQYLLGLQLEGVNVVDISAGERRRTPLHIAAAHNSKDIVNLLIDKDCQLSMDKKGDTALHYAYRSSSTDVIDILEHLSEDGKSLKDMKNDNGELPKDVDQKDLIPLEIKRRGNNAIEIYKRELKKGKQKMPRCSLLILGEEHVGKTSLYRLLVKKGFNPEQESTRGIDDNEVDTVDMRSVNMDNWEEKPKEDREAQVNRTYVEGIGDLLHKMLPDKKTNPNPYVPDKVLSEEELRRKLENLERELSDISSEREVHHNAHLPRQPVTKAEPVSKVPTSRKVTINTRDAPTVAKEQKVKQPAPYSQQSAGHRKEQPRPKPQEPPSKDDEQVVTSTTGPSSVKSTSAPKAEPLPVDSKPKEESDAPSISRRDSESINSMLKAKKKQPKYVKPKLELKALDFAGQKQYRPMHHCFITRRAMYLVVFDLQKMIECIENTKSGSVDTRVADGNVPYSPIEQMRYWLYSIHAHIFPPEESDYMRRVCLVGTHRSPEGMRSITDDELKKIDKRLRNEFSDDDRCTNLFHYMESRMIFAAVENSIDGKENEDRVKSGAADLQHELKQVSQKLKFLDEDHPLIWLLFEQRLLEMRRQLLTENAPLFVTEEKVKEVAKSRGIDDDRSCELALNFFHDTGKLIRLKLVPSLFLNKDEREELANLIILDPAWLIKVMRAIVELKPEEYQHDRKPVNKLINEGVASKNLLLYLWKEFLPDVSNREESFHQLCIILKAYCLVYPLNKNMVLVVASEEPSSSVSSAEVAPPDQRQSLPPTEHFLIPCMLPEDVKDKMEDNHLEWVTFYFDFEKFLPEVIYHRFVCLLLAEYQNASSNKRTIPQFSKTWCRFNEINGCNWKVELMRDAHRLKVSVLASETKNLHQHILYIHKENLSKICAKSEFQGLKYHGGPVAKCSCLNSNEVHCYVSFDMNDNEQTPIDDTPRLDLKCQRCQLKQNIEDLLFYQITKRGAAEKADSMARVQCSSVSSTVGMDQESGKPTLNLKELMRVIKGKASDWEDIGVELEIDDGELKGIKKDNPSDSKSCLRELARKWLSRVDPPPSWAAIADALENIGDEQLASKLRFL